jgi:uncharacterized membrane protein
MAQETENATSEIKDKASDLKDKASSNGGGGVISSLLSKEIVIPALATAGTVAAYAIKKGMSEATDKAEDEAENVGSRAAQGAKKGLAGGLGGMASKAFGGGGGGGGGSAKKTRRLPIQRWTDVAAPIETVYERWTDFEEFPSFMHRVLNVEKEDDTIKWDEKIWFSKRHWEGEITERRKNERIAWKTTSGMAHAGVVTFHRMEKNLTRVMVDMDFVPQGMIEKMASGMRFVKRAVEADLARFKAYVELQRQARGTRGRRQEQGRRQEPERRERQRERGERRRQGARGRPRDRRRP